MANGPRLLSGRLVMRRWRDSDLEPFAALNADPEVMEHFPATLTRPESDGFADRIRPRAADLPGALHARGGGRLAPGPVRLGHGYATEAARAAVAFGFERAHLDEVVSFTATTNLRSEAVMRRLGMTHDPADDFDHPALPEGHPLRRHVLYRPRAGGPRPNSADDRRLGTGRPLAR